jgi:hypothetical protein
VNQLFFNTSFNLYMSFIFYITRNTFLWNFFAKVKTIFRLHKFPVENIFVITAAPYTNKPVLTVGTRQRTLSQRRVKISQN